MTKTYQNISLSNIDTSLSELRIIHPCQISRMECSIKQFGQQTAIVLRKLKENHFQLIDGFKRYYAFENLGTPCIYGQLHEVGDFLATSMIITYNKNSDSLSQFEESLVIKRLQQEHLLGQDEISKLLGKSRSWVCRRLSLIEKLDENVQSQIKLGLLTSSHGRELFRLPCGNQKQVMDTIVKNNLTTSQTKELISKYLKSTNCKEKEFLLAEPLKVISVNENKEDIFDNRLSGFGNKLLKTSHILKIQLHILNGYLTNNQDVYYLSEIELDILSPKLLHVKEKSAHIVSLITKYLENQEL